MLDAVAKELPRRVSAWNRGRKWELFQQRFPFDPEVRILDVGFSPPEHQAADNYLESHYPRLDRVTALTVQDPRDSAARYPGLNVVRYDGVKMPFPDGEFDIVWSNAVLEHVGDPAAQVGFLREVDRVGKHHFVTTPNRWFPVEVHTRIPLLHWLPPHMFDRYLHRVGKSWAADDFMWLLSGPQFRRRLVEAGVTDAQLVRNRLGGPVLDFVAIW